MSAFLAVKVGEQSRHVLLHEGRDERAMKVQEEILRATRGKTAPIESQLSTQSVVLT
jgi:hypothetical protein